VAGATCIESGIIAAAASEEEEETYLEYGEEENISVTAAIRRAVKQMAQHA